ncbi:hypothetical protein E3N88_05844 [Mikania micrantha]|uniref:Uncharacterized protein n=1 Tax=Mikania micrantha TaxID=192012 RepID=A0A5N6PM54_9ASTR|nr:hypothetical protein E3N88_05844 [Mikania micrantha]
MRGKWRMAPGRMRTFEGLGFEWEGSSNEDVLLPNEVQPAHGCGSSGHSPLVIRPAGSRHSAVVGVGEPHFHFKDSKLRSVVLSCRARRGLRVGARITEIGGEMKKL